MENTLNCILTSSCLLLNQLGGDQKSIVEIMISACKLIKIRFNDLID